MSSTPSDPAGVLSGYLGAAVALGLASAGAAYGTYKSSAGVAAVAAKHAPHTIRSMVPIVIAGVLAIYGLIVAVVLSAKINPIEGYSLASGYAHLAAGLACGLACLSSGWAVGNIGHQGLVTYAEVVAAAMAPEAPDEGVSQPLLSQPQPNAKLGRSIYVSMVLNLIYAEAIGLYGLLVAVFIAYKT